MDDDEDEDEDEDLISCRYCHMSLEIELIRVNLKLFDNQMQFRNFI